GSHFDAGTFRGCLAQRTTVGDPPLGQIIRRDSDGDRVARQDPDEILAYSPRNMGNELMSAFQAYAKLGICQRLDNFALDLDRFFLRHENFLPVGLEPSMSSVAVC